MLIFLIMSWFRKGNFILLFEILQQTLQEIPSQKMQNSAENRFVTMPVFEIP
jgi:hypothetical protein